MEDLLPLLASGEIDLIAGRLYEPAIPDGFTREVLRSEPVSVLARADHPIFHGPIAIDELLRYELVLPTVTQRVRREIEHLLSLLGIDPATSLRSSSYALIRELLHGTDMLAVMPRVMMVGDLLRRTLRVVPLSIPAPDRPAGLVLPRDGKLAAAANSFIICLRTYIAEITASEINAAITNANTHAGRSDKTRSGSQV